MFRFSIRELMLVTLVVGLGIGWWIERRHEQDELKSLTRKAMALEKAADHLGYSCSFVENQLSLVTSHRWSGAPPYWIKVDKNGGVSASASPAYRE